MKKIFVLTGEPSGDKLASKVISKLKNSNPDIEYLICWWRIFKSSWISNLFMNLKRLLILDLLKFY